MDFSLIGLTGRDKRVYEALIVQPMASVRALAEHTKINRGSVYESIKSLRAQGLVSYVEVGKQTRYSAEDPELLHEIIRERRATLREQHVNVDRYISHLALERRDPGVFHFASFYEGNEGLANILRDVLSTCRKQKLTEYLAISSPKVSEYMYNNFPNFTRERVRRGVTVRVLRQGKPVRELADYAESRYLTDTTDTLCYTLIYGNKVALVTVDGYNHMSGIVVVDPGITKIQTSLFEHTWQYLATPKNT